jgi:prepilin-type N-terminal cleavage/methylation domain-containing protein
MQIFSKLHTQFSSRGNRNVATRALIATTQPRGFTLIELLISIGIIGILTSIVLVRYGSFNSTTLLKGAAYEIGLNMREAQVRSISASRAVDNTFDRPFGLSFSSSTPKSYILFSDLDTILPPKYESDETVLTFNIQGTSRISTLCITRSVGSPSLVCNLDRLDISFQRPEYKALISASIGGTVYTNITDAQIKLYSTKGDAGQLFVVTVSQLGQINVTAGN